MNIGSIGEEIIKAMAVLGKIGIMSSQLVVEPEDFARIEKWYGSKVPYIKDDSVIRVWGGPFFSHVDIVKGES